jgi:hypothetical protein
LEDDRHAAKLAKKADAARVEKERRIAAEAAAERAEFECVACFRDGGGKRARLLPCRHAVLCAACVEEWLAKSRTCPLCRAAVEEVVVYR